VETREALRQLGATSSTLTSEETQQLDHDAFLAMPGFLTAAEMRALADKFDELLEEERRRAGIEAHQEKGADRLANLVNKDPIFETCFTHPRILAAIDHIINGEIKLNSLNGRAAVPAEGLQPLHSDYGLGTGDERIYAEATVDPGHYRVCNSIWLLDDFTEENGATRVVPGSHRWQKVPSEEIPNPMASHPDEQLLIYPAGTVVIFNGHVWHGGTKNVSDRPRRALHSSFSDREFRQSTDQRRYIIGEVYSRLSHAARHILELPEQEIIIEGQIYV
jgi:ectoine hydroxylase-related dioxygenase (phytanoyl-CoA dioxygenase family)